MRSRTSDVIGCSRCPSENEGQVTTLKKSHRRTGVGDDDGCRRGRDELAALPRLETRVGPLATQDQEDGVIKTRIVVKRHMQRHIKVSEILAAALARLETRVVSGVLAGSASTARNTSGSIGHKRQKRNTR